MGSKARPQATVDDVRSFWEGAPLWSGESRHPPGSRAFFEEHRQVVLDDCLGGALDPRTLPDAAHRDRVLDLGCGPGFWTVELGRLGCTRLVAADLTDAALDLARRRAELFGVAATFQRENAEALSFPDGHFAHVNCQGVIHHTPDTARAVAEIARVLEPDGTASLSVYYRNAILRAWPLLRPLGAAIYKAGGGLAGRGREPMILQRNIDEIVRMYDGADNPIGKSYSRRGFIELLAPWFHVEHTFLHFFPARALPLRLPRPLHRALDARLGFMIYASVRKRG